MEHTPKKLEQRINDVLMDADLQNEPEGNALRYDVETLARSRDNWKHMAEQNAVKLENLTKAHRTLQTAHEVIVPRLQQDRDRYKERGDRYKTILMAAVPIIVHGLSMLPGMDRRDMDEPLAESLNILRDQLNTLHDELTTEATT